MSARRLAAVSVDLDEIGRYHRIHGLPPPRGEAARAVYERALDRHLGLLDALGVPATFFAIGEDLAEPENARRLRDVARLGHEIGNHSLAHRYDLLRLPAEAIRREVLGGIDAIRIATGDSPVGFRAPGYLVDDTVFSILADAGVKYDSSVFPSAPYWALKAVVLGAMALTGRRSDSVLGSPRVLLAPAVPHRRRGVLEIPIGVVPGIGVPFIGTTLALAGVAGARALARAMSLRRFVNLELHGIDLCDADEDGLGLLRAHQPDLRRSRAAKESAIRAAIDTLRDRGYEFVRLRDVSH